MSLSKDSSPLKCESAGPKGEPRRLLLDRSVQILVFIVVFLTLGIASDCASAQNKKRTGSSSRTHRSEAIRAIPINRINQAAGRRIQSVVKNPSFYRRLPTETISADPDYFRFLVRKPEVIVGIWQLMGVTQMTAERTAPYALSTNDGAGTTSDLELIYGNDNLHVYYGVGSYTGSLIKQKLTGRCVILLRTRANGDGPSSQLTNQLDIFLKVDNAAASLVTRTIQPLVGSTADHNFVESMKFVERLNDSTKANGPGVKEMAKRLRIGEDVRKEFAAAVDQVFESNFSDQYGVSSNAQPRQTAVRAQNANVPQAQNPNVVSTRQRATRSDARQRPPAVVQPQTLSRPDTTLKQRVTFGDPSARFAPEAVCFAVGADLAGVSVLIGGPRPALNAAEPAKTQVATSYRLTDQPSGPVARSARELPPIVPGPIVNPSVFRQPGAGRFVPVHKVPR